MATTIKPVEKNTRALIFEPLPHPLTHIRVVEILPLFDNEDLTIRCRLKNVHLLDWSQYYTALSYAWGPQNERLPIMVNGAVFNIGRNLYDFFTVYRERLMQRSLPTVFLWVDAICIDHHNLNEKNAQVQIMASIYQRAKVVFAWFQPHPHPPDNAVTNGSYDLQDTIDFLVEAEQDLKKLRTHHSDYHLAAKYLPSRVKHPAQQDVTVRGSASNFSPHWKSLLHLCQNDFWNRRWVVCELFHASELVFMCGNLTFSLSEWRAPFILLWAMMRLNIYGPHESEDNCAFEPISIFTTPASSVLLSRLVLEDEMPTFGDRADRGTYGSFGTERWQWTNEREPLPTLLERYETWKCSEAVDRIYSILGLSDSQLTVDYDRNNIELFGAVLLNLKAQVDAKTVHILGRTLGLAAFDKPIEAGNENVALPSLVNHTVRKAFSVKPIRFRNEFADIINARVGTNKTNFYRFTSQQDLDKMQHWEDFPSTKVGETPTLRPGTQMRIVDGFDLSVPDFRPALFLNGGKALLGISSTDFIQDGDILCTESSMHVGIVLRISGLSKTWLTVVSAVIFARQVGVHGEFTAIPSLKAASLNDFCEHAQPTPFTIVSPWSKEYMKLKPHNVSLRGFFKGENNSRPPSSLLRAFSSRSHRVERWLDVVSPTRRSGDSR